MSGKTSHSSVKKAPMALLGVAQSAVKAAPQAQEGPKAPTLGIYTKSSSPPPEASAEDVKKIVRGLRSERYELLSTARKVLLASPDAQKLAFPHNHHRTCKCAWITRGYSVGVLKDVAHEKAFYSDLVACGSVWTCPVCSAKVQERRREEISLAVEWAYQHALQPMLVTLTFPHKSWHLLESLLEQQAGALKRLRAGKAWQKIKRSMGFVALIRSLEITRGENGWHPHTHELWFVRQDADYKLLLRQVRRRWLMCCIKAGLVDPNDFGQVKAFMRHAVDIKPNCSASDYLAKQDDSRHWGVDRELAKGSTKKGRATGKHAFALLKEAGAGGVGSAQAEHLFREYAEAMRGKRQIFWSHRFKAKVGIADLSDEQLAEEQREEAAELGRIDLEDWKLVRQQGKRAAVLDAAEVGGWQAVELVIEQAIEQEIARLEALLKAPDCIVAPRGMGQRPMSPFASTLPIAPLQISTAPPAWRSACRVANCLHITLPPPRPGKQGRRPYNLNLSQCVH